MNDAKTVSPVQTIARGDGPARVRIDALDLTIGSRRLIRSLSLEVRGGECWTILGQNGCGKSTLLRALAGGASSRPISIELSGRRLPDIAIAELARLRAYMAQDQSDVFGLSVLQTVLLARYPMGRHWDSPDDVQAAREALRRLDVEALAERDVRTLSGGERQRVGLAAVLAQDTPLLLLDEPNNHLDLPHQMLLATVLNKLTREQERAVVLVAHDVNWALRFASHCLLILPGGDWAAGPADEVLTEAALSRCLGYPVQSFEHQGRRLWLPTV